MKNIKLLIEYDGTNYNGWQKQPNCISIQEKLENAIRNVTNEKIDLIGSGRTDAKVHALAQVANFMTKSKVPEDKYAIAINTFLPNDIAVLNSKEVPLDFHSRYSSIFKIYKYRILNTDIRRPLESNYSFHVRDELDVNLMKKQSKLLLGEHDFKAFSKTGSSIKTSIRTIYEINIFQDGDIIEIEFKGNAFLYNMVRIIVGTLIELGKNSLKFDINMALLTGARMYAGPTAPPQGLFLKKVSYNIDNIG